ncbi:MAG: AI-2E family transporter, partial [Lysobacter spongiicola]|nr:AI-2E family transporter [Lysobacter spongiicola]
MTTDAAAPGTPPAPTDGPATDPADADPPLSSVRPRASTPLLVLTVLAVGATLWAAQSVILPILLAVFFALIGNPLLRGLQRLRLPRMLGAALVLLTGMAMAGVLANQLVEPAAEWARQVPRELAQLGPQLQEMTKPVKAANEAAENIARAADGEDG